MKPPKPLAPRQIKAILKTSAYLIRHRSQRLKAMKGPVK